MKVKDLVEKLSKCDPELEVYAYDETEEVWAGNFKVSEKTEFPYVKADPPSNLEERFVLLSGREF